MSAFLIVLREGAEAALLIGLLFTGLRSLGRADQGRWVWGGVAGAVAASTAAGAALYATVGPLEGRAEAIVEGVVALLAVGVLTGMVLWMAARSGSVRSRLAGQVETALSNRGGWGLAIVAFAVVVREGLETALFLIAAAGSGLSQLAGGLGGLGAAAAIGYLVYRGGRRFDVRLFFRVTGVLILLFAAGLLVKGIHEFHEAGLLPAVVDPIWALGFGDPESSLPGRVAAEVFGWTPAPSLLQVVAYWAYLIPAGIAFAHLARPRQSAPRAVASEPEGEGARRSSPAAAEGQAQRMPVS